jgi:hypothetical protein
LCGLKLRCHRERGGSVENVTPSSPEHSEGRIEGLADGIVECQMAESRRKTLSLHRGRG